MADLTKCNSCDSCNSCLTSCNSCNSCNGNCQSNKQLISSKLGKFCFRNNTSNNRLAKDDLFLTEDEWNKLITFIYNGYNLAGSPNKSQANSVNTFKVDDIKMMKASMFNGAMQKMNYASTNSNTVPSGYKKEGGPNGDIVYASYFRDLEDYTNTVFKSVYCDDCNSCEGCLSCNSCQSGQCSTSSYCCACDKSCNSGQDGGGGSP